MRFEMDLISGSGIFSLAPAFTAASLSDADFVWYAPSGATFTGKGLYGDPAWIAHFNEVGQYRVYCTNWAAVTKMVFEGCTLTSLVLPPGIGLVGSVTLLGTPGLDVQFNYHLTTLDLTNCPGIKAVRVSNTALQTLDISPCPLLEKVQASDCRLTSAAVDAILANLVAAGLTKPPAYAVVSLNNIDNEEPGDPDYDTETPSVAGLASKTTLESRGWTVNVAS
jgi:hypothetical protein